MVRRKVWEQKAVLEDPVDIALMGDWMLVVETLEHQFRLSISLDSETVRNGRSMVALGKTKVTIRTHGSRTRRRDLKNGVDQLKHALMHPLTHRYGKIRRVTINVPRNRAIV